MLKFLFSFLVFISLSTGFVNAEKVNKILINGNERVSDDTVLLFGEINLYEDYDNNKLNKILQNLYDTNFFKDVKVELNNNILNIKLVENPIIKSVTIEGIKAKKIREPILDSLKLKKNNSFNEYFARIDRDNIINGLKASGYYFADVKLSISENKDNSVNIIYNIDLGKKAVIHKIKFIGDKKFRNRKLFKIIVSEENKFWKFISRKKLLNESRIELDTRLLTNFYKNKGYYNVKVESSFAQFLDEGNFDLVFNINAGEKFFFNELDLKLPSNYNIDNFSKITDIFKEIKNEPYSFNSIEKILEEIESVALNKEFESINATVEETIVGKNKLNFSVFIDELPKMYVERINIVGNNITRENVIRNRLTLDEGDAFNKILHAKSISSIKALNFFKTVNSEIVDGSTDSKKIINIEVEEKPTGEISAGAGIGTSGGSIAFGIKENNFLGRGIEFSSDLELTDESIRGKFFIVNPNYKGSDNRLIAGVQSSENDRMSSFGYKTTKTGFNIGTRFEYFEDLFFTPSVTSFYESLKTSSTASNALKKQKGTYFDTDINYALDYDKRNQKFQPTKGFRSKFDQSIPVISDTNSIINGYEFVYYNEIFEEAISTFSFYSRAINSISGEDVRISERLYIPSNKLRGFEAGKVGPIDNEDFVGGNYVMAMNLAATLPNVLPNIQNADFSVFFDAGNVWGVDYSSTINDSSKIRSSVGIGVDWYTPVGPLSFSYAGIISRKDTDKKEAFRFNLGTTF